MSHNGGTALGSAALFMHVSLNTGCCSGEITERCTPTGVRCGGVLSSPDRLWGPPNLLYIGYRELFPGGKAAEA
jgi:hypothetical protein